MLRDPERNADGTKISCVSSGVTSKLSVIVKIIDEGILGPVEFRTVAVDYSR